MYQTLLIIGIVATLVAMIIVSNTTLNNNQWWRFGWVVPAILLILGIILMVEGRAEKPTPPPAKEEAAETATPDPAEEEGEIIETPPPPVYSETIAVSYTVTLKKNGRFYNEEVSVDSQGGNARVLKTHFVGTDKVLFTVIIDGKRRLYEAQNPEDFIAAYHSKRGPNSTCGKPQYKVGENGCKLSELFVTVPVMDTVLLRELNFGSVPLHRHR